MKTLISSLDIPYQSPTQLFPNVETYAMLFGKQIKPQCAIIINGKPLVSPTNDSKIEFQKKWLLTPLTSHQLSSFDCHIIPGTESIVVNAGGKVKFDESGRSRLGESADLTIAGMTPMLNTRPIWGSWFGFNLNLVIDLDTINNIELQSINTFNYRITFKPNDSVIQL